MEQATAQQLFKQGAFVIVLDMPVGTEFGIDYNSWNVGPNFKGVKMVPPGLHFLYSSATNFGAQSTDDSGRLRRRPETAPRTGLFRHLAAREVAVYRWDTATEEMVAVFDPEACAPLEANLRQLDPCLGPYPFDHSLKRWLSLTSHISEAVVARVNPRSGKVASVTVHSTPTVGESMEQTSESAVVDGRFPELRWDVDADSACRFTPIPGVPSAASPQVRTQCFLDKTFALEKMLTALQHDTAQLLGELQYAFVTFIVGQVFDGFEHWKQLIALLCNCDEALLCHPKLFLDLIGLPHFDVFLLPSSSHLMLLRGVLHFQLRETPKDFFVDIISESNFLTVTLQSFFTRVAQEPAVDPTLRARSLKFQQHLNEHFQWDFAPVEADDEAPLVVELSEPVGE